MVKDQERQNTGQEPLRKTRRGKSAPPLLYTFPHGDVGKETNPLAQTSKAPFPIHGRMKTFVLCQVSSF